MGVDRRTFQEECEDEAEGRAMMVRGRCGGRAGTERTMLRFLGPP